MAAPVLSLSLYGCSSAGPVEFGAGTPEELEVARQIALQEIELRVPPEVVSTREDLEVRRIFLDELAMAHTHVQQKHRGVPVFGGEAIVHLHKDGSFADMTDGLSRRVPKDLDVTPKFNALKARELVLGNYECATCLTAEPEVDLLVLPYGREARLAYRVQLRREDGSDEMGMPVVFLDAHTGEKLLEYDNLQTVTGTGTSLYNGTVTFETSLYNGVYYMEDLTRKIGTFTNNNTPTSNSGAGTTSRCTDTDNIWNATSQRACVEAHWCASRVYDYYKNVHGRNGIDNAGGPGAIAAVANSAIKLISSVVHYGNKYNNAYWNGSYMTYGDGDGTTFAPLISLDICGHEMTHGVTERTANLTYSGESGALNESFSDFFGALIEGYVKGTTNMWKIGEEPYTPSNGTSDALRYMDDPHKASNSGYTADDDPDHYTERYTGSSDNGGVHINSGIPNKMFYLLSVGGTHHKGGTVTGIGSDAAGKIAYRALTTYMVSSTNFAGARTAMEKAATDLYGAGSAQVTAVSAAWTAVGVGAGGGGGPTACAHSRCTSGVALTSGCTTNGTTDTCVQKICTTDPYCCTTAWDSVCVGEVQSICSLTCP